MQDGELQPIRPMRTRGSEGTRTRDLLLGKQAFCLRLTYQNHTICQVTFNVSKFSH